jgi:hypothetical protein
MQKRSAPGNRGIASTIHLFLPEILKLSVYTPDYLRMPNFSMTCL